jgi:hypothetical protein
MMALQMLTLGLTGPCFVRELADGALSSAAVHAKCRGEHSTKAQASAQANPSIP